MIKNILYKPGDLRLSQICQKEQAPISCHTHVASSDGISTFEIDL